MGLDLVELVLAVEERFGIDVPDEVVGRLRTCGDYLEFVIRALETRRCVAGRCVTPVVFGEVRRHLMTIAGARRSAIRLQTRLADLLPERERGRMWESLAVAAACRLPGLRYSRPVYYGLLTFSVVSFAALLGIVGDAVATPYGWAICLPFLIIWWCVVMLLDDLFRRWRRQVPHSVGTVEGLVMAVTERRFGRAVAQAGGVFAKGSPDLAACDGGIDRDAVWVELRRVIAVQLGVDESRVVPGARIIEDLGAG